MSNILNIYIPALDWVTGFAVTNNGTILNSTNNTNT